MSSDWILDFVEEGRYFSVAFLMLLENVFPPIPSEVVMPVTGIVVERGDMALVPAILSGTAGALGGQLLWYWFGLQVGEECLKRLAARHGRWMTVSPRDIDRADEWFDRHGHKAVLVGRVVPAVRTLISLPAGLSEMPLPKFLTYSFIGTAIWTSLLAWAGYALGAQYHSITRWIGVASTAILVGAAAWYLYRVVTFRGPRAG